MKDCDRRVKAHPELLARLGYIERMVFNRARLGEANDEIALEMGLSVGQVVGALQGVRRKILEER